jgi:RHS repeat-associated protein
LVFVSKDNRSNAERAASVAPAPKQWLGAWRRISSANRHGCAGRWARGAARGRHAQPALLRRQPRRAAPLVWYEGATLAAPRYLHADERGSILAVTDASGALLAANGYSPLGEPNIHHAGRFGFTGQVALPGAPGARLWHMKARAHAPLHGRFLQTDPLGIADDPNRYAYVQNDPVNLSDPTGEVGVAGAAGSVVLGGAIRFATGQRVFDARAIGFDAATGAVGAGLVSKAAQLWKLRGLGLGVAQQLGATARLSRAPTEGVYVLRAGSRRYVGQSGDLPIRSAVSAVERQLTTAPVVRIGVAGGKTSREVAEQRVLDAMRLRGVQGILNVRNPVGAARQQLLTQPGLGQIGSVYAPSASNFLSASAGAVTGTARNKKP